MKKLLALLLLSFSVFATNDLVVKGVLLKDTLAYGGFTIWDVDNNKRYDIGQPDIELTDLTFGKFRIQPQEEYFSVRMVGIVSTLLKVVEKEKVLTPEEYKEMLKKN